jgi:hypothetical protein
MYTFLYFNLCFFSASILSKSGLAKNEFLE